MDINQAAALLGRKPSTLRRQIKRHKLRARRMGGNWFVTLEEVERYRAENRRADRPTVTP